MNVCMQCVLLRYFLCSFFILHIEKVQWTNFSSFTDNNSRKKKVYEQQENEENPLKCPVKLYEFYLSKW